MAKILFACKKAGDAPLVAAAYAIHISGRNDLTIHAATENPLVNYEEVEGFLGTHGISGIPTLLDLGGIILREYDLIVCLCRVDGDILKRFPGGPVVISWPVCDTSGYGLPGREEYNEIVRRTRELFDLGYLDALITSKVQSELVLESLKEGIIAHDLQRRIFVFNRAAERITGYSREEVLGRDCHEVFPGKFCGEKCTFCNISSHDPDALKREYSVSLQARNGERRIIDMNLFPLRGADGKPYGIVASFRDITEELTLKRRLLSSGSFHGMVGKDPKMQDLFATIEDVAQSDLPVLILGESGTGKEMVALLIHELSPRKGHLFVPVNCGAIPENLLESELFGHEKGAFTGAIREKRGRFELAHRGTLFLDEIGDLPLSMQVKLLRVLQDGTFEKVGGERRIKVDARIVAATNKDLEQAVKKGEFREDLYYRICVFPVHVPSLRERKSDIPLLANHFLEKGLAAYGRRGPDCAIGSDAMAMLMAYNWPGNVRELENAIQYALLKCKGRLIEPCHLPRQLIHEQEGRSIAVVAPPGPAPPADRPKKRGRKPKPLTVDTVKDALVAAGQNKKRAAEMLGISRATLYRFLGRNSLK